MDADHQNHHLSVGGVLWAEPGQRGAPGARRLLLWEHLVSPLHQIQEERSEAQRGTGRRRCCQTAVAAWGDPWVWRIALNVNCCFGMFLVHPSATPHWGKSHLGEAVTPQHLPSAGRHLLCDGMNLLRPQFCHAGLSLPCNAANGVGTV